MLIHVFAQHLGKQKCLALLFWYAFTGCDAVSSFSSHRKKLLVREAFPEITGVFARLSLGSADIVDDYLNLTKICCFVL